MISQKTKINIEVTKIAIIDISSSDSLPSKELCNFEEIKLVIETLIISSKSKIVAIIVAGLFIKVSRSFPEEDFFFIKLTWYLWSEKIELSVIEKKAERSTSSKIIKKNKYWSLIRIYG